MPWNDPPTTTPRSGPGRMLKGFAFECSAPPRPVPPQMGREPERTMADFVQSKVTKSAVL
jgi:hypothetical protein